MGKGVYVCVGVMVGECAEICQIMWAKIWRETRVQCALWYTGFSDKDWNAAVKQATPGTQRPLLVHRWISFFDPIITFVVPLWGHSKFLTILFGQRSSREIICASQRAWSYINNRSTKALAKLVQVWFVRWNYLVLIHASLNPWLLFPKLLQ